ncbi:Brf1-like TBP-binding domain-containing protein, partial [Bombardia bombarda]
AGKPKPKKPNAVRRIMNREESRERRVRESSVAAVASAAASRPRNAPRRQCGNNACKSTNIVDGTCQDCGQVADDSNIVSEVMFGESSNGAAIVQGSYMAADQGGVRSQGGLAFRRVAGGGASEARERSFRECKQLLSQFAQQLRINQTLADTAYRYYRVASNNNFVQGRRKNNVAAICLYAACRKDTSNRVMLIDLADLIKTDVFLLGRGYKEFLSQFPDMREGTKPIILEDLIFRFATKLEFYHDTNKVADAAVRIAARMRHDNITHGRRPAGICGAAIIMAARAHNYRRTVREVVFIAKVTMNTLQERMEEFANVPSAQLTISEFNQQQIDKDAPSFDPPFVYKQSKEWQEKHPTRKRKIREAVGAGDDQESGQDDAEQNRDKPSPAPVLDKDGFVVPPLPQRAPEPVAEQTVDAHDVSIIVTAAVEPDDQLEALASEYGDDDSDDSEMDPSSEMAMAAAQGIELPGGMKTKRREGGKASQGNAGGSARTTRRSKKNKPQMPVNQEWEMDEANLEKEMESHLNDPALIGASAVVTKDIEERRAQEIEETPAVSNDASNNTLPAPGYTYGSKVSDDPIIHEDEFKDDPEVMYCRLGEEEVKIKERIWANHNKDYMRQVQQKIFETKMAEHQPAKQRRNRAKKARIGEGASPAQSAEEAAINMMQNRGISRKLDYSRLGQVFDLSNRGPGSTYGGASSVGSHSALGSVVGSEYGSDDENPTPPPIEATEADKASSPIPEATGEEDDEAVDEDDYEASHVYGGENGYEDETFVEDDINPFADNDGSDDFGEDDY